MMAPDVVTAEDPLLAALDEAGFCAGAVETAEGFLDRCGRMRAAWALLETELAEKGAAERFGAALTPECRIAPETLEEAGEITAALYGFRHREIPGFYLDRGIGWLWGGCLVCESEEDLALLLLRGSFRRRARWLFYRRRELVAHELCHAARMALGETTLEEHFAYQSDSSALRRLLGNCFIRDADAFLFMVPALLLAAATVTAALTGWALPLWPFWCFALAAPAWLLVRNARSRGEVRRARAALRRAGVAAPEPVLFRSTREELREIAVLPDRAALDAYAAERADGGSARWRILRYRFLAPPVPAAPEAGS